MLPVTPTAYCSCRDDDYECNVQLGATWTTNYTCQAGVSWPDWSRDCDHGSYFVPSFYKLSLATSCTVHAADSVKHDGAHVKCNATAASSGTSAAVIILVVLAVLAVISGAVFVIVKYARQRPSWESWLSHWTSHNNNITDEYDGLVAGEPETESLKSSDDHVVMFDSSTLKLGPLSPAEPSASKSSPKSSQDKPLI